MAGADAVLDPCAGAMAAFQAGEVGVGLVGEDRLEAVAVVVGEEELRAGMGPLDADDHARPFRPSGEVEAASEFSDLTVVARLTVGVERCGPRRLGQGEDRPPDESRRTARADA